MKNERILKALGEIDDDLVLESAPGESIKKRIPIKWLSAAASLLLAAAVGIGAWQAGLFLKNPGPETADKRWPEKQLTGGTNTSEEIAREPAWDEMTISQQFGEVEFNSARYHSQTTEIGGGRVGRALGSASLSGQDIYTNKIHTAAADIFEINGLSADCAVALMFEGREDYYVYVNHYYTPKSLGSFIDDLSLEENLFFGSAWYDFRNGDGSISLIEFVGLEDSVVWRMLLDERSLLPVDDYDKHFFITVMSISVNIPLLGYENISLGVTEDGYLTTNILGTGKAFYIGAEKAARFVDYVIENCEGYEIVSYPNQTQIPEIYQDIPATDGAVSSPHKP